MKKILLFSAALVVLFSSQTISQSKIFTRQDTLRGTVTKEREWWDLKYYHLSVAVNPLDSSIVGNNIVRYKVLKPNNIMQIDLQPPLKISKVEQNNNMLQFSNEGKAYFIRLTETQKAGEVKEITIFYQGKPQVAKNPPWNGGVSWKKDSNGNDYIATTCQGDGASLWWPCKDHQYDEVDSMLISVTVPENLVDVSNGRLRSIINNSDNTKTYNWAVTNPINNYCVNMNIGNYLHFSEVYNGEKGKLDCDYWVLPENLEKAKAHFKDVKRMFDAFEYWFGPYPFYEDSYKLVDVSYTGMEHQSSVTYGNLYQNGYRKRDESRSGWGLKFDFIIIHESAHEWFGNSITSKDIADMWIHESFGAYSESLFTDYHYGKQAGNEYLIGTRANIRNNRPIIGFYNVNSEGSGDMYAKGANMLHTIRQIVNDDTKFRNIIRGISKTFYHQTVTTEQIEKYISQESGLDLTSLFNQYLRNKEIPVFEYKVVDSKIRYRWTNCIDGFNMPLRIFIDQKEKWVEPSLEWNEIDINPDAKISIDNNFYISIKSIQP